MLGEQHGDYMRKDKALMRQHLERIEGVTRTWIEWDSSQGSMTKTLVVEVDFDTDPNAGGHHREIIDAVWDTARAVSKDTTMVFSSLRIVPRNRDNANRP
jgi:hypothetical protein